MTGILELKNINFSYDKRKILNDISFEINKSEILTILGPNGAGKSTLLKVIVTLLKQDSGEVYIDSKRNTDLDFSQRAQKIGYVSQSIDLKYAYTVFDFILMGRASYISTFRQPKEIDIEISNEAIKKMGLEDLKYKKITEISGGERQKAMIAKALAQKPDILIFDEPTSALDISNQNIVLKLIRSLKLEGFTIIFTTHSPDHALILDEKTLLIDKKGKNYFGKTKDILTQERLSEVFNTEVLIEYNEKLRRKVCLNKIL